MKTVLTICILLASILFSPPVISRELAQSGTGEPNDPKGPIIKCDPKSPTYKSNCIAQPEPKANCKPNSGTYSRCPGTRTSPTRKNHNNPPVNPPAKPGTGAGGTGNPNNPAPCDPKSPQYAHCVSSSKPKHKCVPTGTPYNRCPPEDP